VTMGWDSSCGRCFCILSSPSRRNLFYTSVLVYPPKHHCQRRISGIKITKIYCKMPTITANQVPYTNKAAAMYRGLGSLPAVSSRSQATVDRKDNAFYQPQPTGVCCPHIFHYAWPYTVFPLNAGGLHHTRLLQPLVRNVISSPLSSAQICVVVPPNWTTVKVQAQ